MRGPCDQCGHLTTVRQVLIERENCVYEMCARCARLTGAVAWIDPYDRK